MGCWGSPKKSRGKGGEVEGGEGKESLVKLEVEKKTELLFEGVEEEVEEEEELDYISVKKVGGGEMKKVGGGVLRIREKEEEK